MQDDLREEPYDRWVLDDGRSKAEFRRHSAGFHVRFIGEVDFLVRSDLSEVEAYPAPGTSDQQVQSLFGNAIEPLLGNHAGGLFLHGSAILHQDRAIAFIGPPRSGKTTLAAFFARSGFELLTEDTVELERSGETYRLRPKATPLRLFPDSAEHIFEKSDAGGELKIAIGVNDGVRFADEPARLAAIFLLDGTCHEGPTIQQVKPADALATIMQHAFVLDVEDNRRLKDHFERLARLCEIVPAATLNYPRRYSALPRLIESITQAADRFEDGHAAG